MTTTRYFVESCKIPLFNDMLDLRFRVILLGVVVPSPNLPRAKTRTVLAKFNRIQALHVLSMSQALERCVSCNTHQPGRSFSAIEIRRCV